MIKYDNAHPNGIKILPDLRVTPPSPVAVRSMTEEERERYGLAQPRPARGMSPVSKVYYAYLDGNLSRHKRYDHPVSVCDCLRRFREV